MNPPTPLVVVSGPPASGKTFIANVLAESLSLPLIAKDAIKEVLYDHVGTGDAAWSQKLGRATFALMYQAVESQARARRPAIVEANFAAREARGWFLGLADRYSVDFLEVHCTAGAETLLARYAARAGSRHAGHVDDQRLDDMQSALASRRHAELHLGGRLIVLNTTSFANVDVDAVVEAAQAHMNSEVDT